MTTAIDFQSVDILFAKGTGKSRDQALARAEAMLDSGSDRSAIAAETGVVLGVAGAKLSVKAGEISVLMGLLLGAAGLAVNWYYKHKLTKLEMQLKREAAERERTEHAARMVMYQ